MPNTGFAKMTGADCLELLSFVPDDSEVLSIRHLSKVLNVSDNETKLKT